MEHIKEKSKKTKKDFSPNEAVFVFSSFTFKCISPRITWTTQTKAIKTIRY